ncbi:hypothetical protein ABZW18_25830 [Streptomyces sp. NPDC004647]|uniref:hypothetical protein n=1 Tax=Streptomyces sp. NPDC004647 TaxID=3154671 RepID=UPI0033A84174
MHAQALPYPVVGVFVRASTLVKAEAEAEAVWLRTVAIHPFLESWELLRSEVPLLALDVELPPSGGGPLD